MKKKLFGIACSVACLSLSLAQGAVLQLSLTPSIALEPSTEHISGLLLNISGSNPQTGLALGIINRSDGVSGGISLALLRNNSDIYSGMQVALNNTAWGLRGVQVGAINNSAGHSNGVQAGLLNFNGSFNFWHGGGSNSFSGLQIGLINMEREISGAQLGLINLSGTAKGVQLGAFNYAENLSGVQIGVFNRAQNLYGIQLGVFNWVDTSPWFSETPDKLATVFPFVNWAF